MSPTRRLVLALLLAIASCRTPLSEAALPDSPYVLVLGSAQDAGLPQLGCRRPCCETARANPERRRFASSLLLVDPRSGQRWLFDAGPDLREQIELARGHGNAGSPPTKGRPPLFDGIFITHAHMGHYAGLLHLGREAYGTASTLLYGSPRLCAFLEGNGPWDLLISAEHLQLEPLAAGQSVTLADDLKVTAMAVPHRDEYSDTLAFRIDGPERSVLYLPDIDKWSRWERPLARVLDSVDGAFLDATFFDAGELPGRAMSEVPHPFVVETMELLSEEPSTTRNKVHLIHLNHSNPLADPSSAAAAQVRAAGMHVAHEGDTFEL